MLEAVAQIKLALPAKSCAKTNMIAELEGAAELAVIINEGRRDQMQTDEPAFQIGGHARHCILRRKTEHRSNADLGDGLVIVVRPMPAPPAQRCLPETGHLPVTVIQPTPVPVPQRSRTGHLDIVGLAVLDKDSIHSVYAV